MRDVEATILTEEGHIICYLRDGDRVFLTYSTTGRGNEPVDSSLGLLEMTPLWPPGGVGTTPRAGLRPLRLTPIGGHGAPVCWYWRGNATFGPTSRPVPQWTRPGATPVESLGRPGHHH